MTILEKLKQKYKEIGEEIAALKTGLVDKQPVWCWDDGDTHLRHLRFYDAQGSCTFYWNGTRNGGTYENYEAVNPEHYTEWMIEAQMTLDD